MTKQEDIEIDLSLDVSENCASSPHKGGLAIKREASPLQVDMLSSGNRDSPIYVSGGDIASDVEVDAQTDETEVEHQKSRDFGEEFDLEYLEPAFLAPQEPFEEQRKESTQEPRELSMELSQGPLMQATREPSELSADSLPGDASSRISEQASEACSAAKESGETTTLDDERPWATSTTSTTLANDAPLIDLPPPLSDSEDDETDPRIRIIEEKLRPAKYREAVKAPPATQPPPKSKKRVLATTLEPLVMSQPLKPPKPTPRRRDFLHISTAQPVASVSGSTQSSQLCLSTASTSRMMTVSDSQSDEEPAQKRQKTSASHSPAVVFRGQRLQAHSQAKVQYNKFNRHPEHWHTDGSVILQFQDTAFRLHRSRLSQQSKILAEIFHEEENRIFVNCGYDENGGEGIVHAWLMDNVGGKKRYIVEGVSWQDFAKLLIALDNAV
jgi:hypothetical protein